MSTPLETNTEELQEILRQVYDLPNAVGGQSRADLVIAGVASTGTNDCFEWDSGSYDGRSYGPTYITFDQEEVVAVYEKLLMDKEVRVILSCSNMALNSWDGPFSIIYQAIRVAASHTRSPNYLLVRFDCASHFSSSIGAYYTLEYIFEVDTSARTAVLQNCFCWKRS